MIYIKSLFVAVCIVSICMAQVPNFGRCPEYDPMPDFDRENFLGKWYELERYFSVSEIASRCVAVNYERRPDGRIYVNNEMTNRFTNVQRIVSGVVNYTARNDEATFAVKYAGATNYEVTLNVLDTDYDSFAVVWACSSIAGPVGHTESVWILTRERLPDGPVIQAAHGVLDKYKFSTSLMVKTDQTNCETTAEPNEAIDGPDSGYDIVVDDDTVSHELFNNQGSLPQIHQVQHIAHVQNLQQFSPFHPVQPIPHITTSYYKQGALAEKSASAPNTNPAKTEENPKEPEKAEKTEATTKSTSPIIEALTPKSKPIENKDKENKPEPAKN